MKEKLDSVSDETPITRMDIQKMITSMSSDINIFIDTRLVETEKKIKERFCKDDNIPCLPQLDLSDVILETCPSSLAEWINANSLQIKQPEKPQVSVLPNISPRKNV